ncbi:nucleotidyltransferase family protein [Pseudomonas orientalis]|uniref:nucleotidyltransferase family protein n=1 Tax=Pseudomonas orientalis TaxID=76758 RepID=UPI000F56F044|nr:nucleotidyltransferase family protein [Pseudomonas orientalis]AZE90788.1 Molybdenum cofactor cytidylyltransferase [Pseudomonas orientalis]
MIAAIILAAGRSSRFRAVTGQDKLLASCVGRDGVTRSVLDHVLVNLPPSVGRRLVVTAYDQAEIIRLAQTCGCQVLTLSSTGMADSIAQAVAASSDAEGWLIVLGDMPFILTSTIESVVAGLTVDTIRVPVHTEKYGHPVAFGRGCAQALMELSGDGGARPLFAAFQVTPVNVIDPGVLWDVDVPTGLQWEQVRVPTS